MKKGVHHVNTICFIFLMSHVLLIFLILKMIYLFLKNLFMRLHFYMTSDDLNNMSVGLIMNSSASLCLEILQDTGFTENEIRQIQTAIINHRNMDIKDEKNLSGIIYRADKASRPCHSCLVQDVCNWPIEKQNLMINY